MFGTVRAADLMSWCRAFRHGLDAGLSPVRVFRQQSTSGPSKLRAVAGRVADRMETGDSMEDAFKPEAEQFPTIFVEMIGVGEHAGRLPDIFAELEDYFASLNSSRKEFLTIIAWPAFQYVAAICVITLLIFILGMLGSEIDPLGLGLKGVSGAILFFGGMCAFTFGVLGAFWIVASNRELRAKGEALTLGIPGIGACFRTFAVARFSMAMYMTAEAGSLAARSLRMSLRATSNRAYMRHAEAAAKAARKGEDIPSILGGYGENLFPSDFLNSVAVGEESGQLAEVMKKQAKIYHEEAKSRLRWLSRIAAGLVYAGIGILLIVMIFRIFTAAYLNPLDDAVKAVDNPNRWMQGK